MMSSLIGGVLIGGAASLLLLGNGKVMGVSGILGESIRNEPSGRQWRFGFIGGILVGALLLRYYLPEAFPDEYGAPTYLYAIAGFLVGYGTRMGSGCTSGHGVCGIGRLSPRSLVATAVFMAMGALTVYVLRHVL